MSRKHKLIYKNEQLWNECVLVSIWNAAIYWGINPVPKMGSRNYNKICEKLGCIDDGCDDTCAQKELDRLTLKFKRGVWKPEWVKKNLPVEFGLTVGRNAQLHSVLAVDFAGCYFCITNYDRGHERWLSWSEIKRMGKYNPCGKKHVNCFAPRQILSIYGRKKPINNIKDHYGF